ncbi:MAG: ACT domain-containing protein [Clostridiales bacterium]|nr:ACT domain-containing protein [Clostridiales bacterium]
MKAVITVIGMDRIGIIAGVSAVLADYGVNIEDISQTIMQGYFMMYMLVDVSKATARFDALAQVLAAKGTELGMEIRIQKEEIFRAMHTV